MEVASPQRTTGVKNPEEIRLAYGAITFWILRCAQNGKHVLSNYIVVIRS